MSASPPQNALPLDRAVSCGHSAAAASAAAEGQVIAIGSSQEPSHPARLQLSEQASQGAGEPVLAESMSSDQATRGTSEPGLAAAESLSPESAAVSPARLQSPDQALPGLTAFQKRLHSMLPQLPTLEKLAQLTEEVITNDHDLSFAYLLVSLV